MPRRKGRRCRACRKAVDERDWVTYDGMHEDCAARRMPLGGSSRIGEQAHPTAGRPNARGQSAKNFEINGPGS